MGMSSRSASGSSSSSVAAEDGGAAEEIDRHPLDRADVDERQARAGRGEVGGRQDVGIEGFALQVLPMKPLAVDLVDVGELPARLRLERGELADRLGRQRPPIHQEEHPARDARLHQPVDLIDQGEGLAGARGHGHQHVPLPVGDGPLDGGIGLNLIGAELGVIVGGLGEAVAGSVAVAVEQLAQGVGCVEVGDPARAALRVPHVVVPEDLAVGRIEERDPEPVEVQWALRGTTGVAFSLCEDVLGAEGDLLGFDHAEEAAINAQGIVGGAVVGGELLDGDGLANADGVGGIVLRDLPTGGPKLWVDQAFACLQF